jgi:hypothetical protein
MRMDAWIRALVLIRFGQEIGSEGPVAQAIRDLATVIFAAGK